MQTPPYSTLVCPCGKQGPFLHSCCHICFPYTLMEKIPACIHVAMHRQFRSSYFLQWQLVLDSNLTAFCMHKGLNFSQYFCLLLARLQLVLLADRVQTVYFIKTKFEELHLSSTSPQAISAWRLIYDVRSSALVKPCIINLVHTAVLFVGDFLFLVNI